MAGDWIKMRSGLRNHPKVFRIASALDADRLRVVGGLHAVWCVFDEFSEDGNLNGYSASAIDEIIGWHGFAQAMMAVGWLNMVAEGIECPEFSTHNGASAKRRAQEADRKRNVRSSSGHASAINADKKRTRGEKEDIDQKKELPPFSPKGDKSKKGTRLPEGWQPSAELIVQVEAIGGPQLWRRELPKFVDYWIARPGAGGCKLDWPGTFRNWIRKAAEQQPRHTSTTPSSSRSRQGAIFETLANDHRYADTAARVAGTRHTPGLPAARAALPGLRPGPGHDPDDADCVDADFSEQGHR